MLRSALVAACLALAACSTVPPRETLLAGETMGSAWTVKIAGELPAVAEDLRAAVQGEFDAVNHALSTYRADSALSRFNATATTGWIDIDPELAAVLGYALELAEASGGAYDVTVGPLVNLWGFGPDPATHQVPDATAIAAARARVGWRKVEVDATTNSARKQPGVLTDLSSLGKGRGVDRVARHLDALGVSNYLIDLSGKLRARGASPRGGPWRVAVERPGPDDASGAPRTMPAVIELREQSIATAGDYRRYFESAGKHYSHIIDPTTGYPVAHATVSATVVDADCMRADALATVFMAMPPDAAMQLADRLRVAALIIVRDGAGLRIVRSAAWRD